MFGGQAWTQVPDGEWYLHLFTPEQPDLNWEQPEIREEFHSILRFWLDRGVDGFRIDVAHGLAKDHREPCATSSRTTTARSPRGGEDNPLWDRDDVHDIYRGWHGCWPAIRVTAWRSPRPGWRRRERRARYVRPDELSQAFNFDFLPGGMGLRLAAQVRGVELATVALVGAAPTWVLANHDVVREVTRYGDGPVGQRRARAGALLLLALPGSAYIYQGEELGLPEVLDLPADVLQDPIYEQTDGARMGRDGCRVPIPWSGTAQPFGFGPEGSRPWLPQPDSWRALSAQAESEDAASMLVLYRNALALRQFVRGDAELTWLDDAGEEVLAFRRGDGFACLVNFGDAAVDLPDGAEVLLASDPSYVAGAPLTVDTAVWVRL